MDADSNSGFYLGCALQIVFLAYGIVQIYAGYLGIDYHLGGFWAGAALIAAFLIRLTLPITIGAFFCALDVWGWHWLWALLCAAPGLAFMALMIPGMLAKVARREYW